MRLSTLAALMILTTIMLSACSQQEVAQVIDNSGQFYGRDVYPTYSAFSPAPANPQTDYKYKGSQDYGVDAQVSSVTSTDLPPPSASLASEPVRTTPVALAKPVAPLSTSPLEIAPSAVGEWEWPVHGSASQNMQGEGIVIAASEGVPIRAASSGTVAYVGKNLSDFGNIVILQHRNGMMSSYANAREILVSNGDQIRQGDLLGYVGKTGNVSAPQLGFSMRVEDASVDPLHYLPRSVASR